MRFQITLRAKTECDKMRHFQHFSEASHPLPANETQSFQQLTRNQPPKIDATKCDTFAIFAEICDTVATTFSPERLLTMSQRYNNGSHYENHQQAAELHDLAAHAHRSAAIEHGKEDHLSAHEHSRQSLEHSVRAHEQTQQTHGKHTASRQDIEALARQLWEERGSPAGSPEVDWLRAERQLSAKA